jgi:hypothetical protein
MASATAVPAGSKSVVLAVAAEPNPRFVLAVEALDRSDRLLAFSNLALFKLVKFASTSALVRGEPLPARVTMVVIS